MQGSTRIAPGALTGLWIAAVAVPLLIVLGVLQFRWVGALSERDRESRQAHLTADVRRFGEEFDREITRVFAAFQRGEQADGQDATAANYERWKQQTPYPRLVQGVWMVVAPVPSVAGAQAPMGDGNEIVAPSGGSAAMGSPDAWRVMRLDMHSRRLIEVQVPGWLEALRQRFQLPTSPGSPLPDEYSALRSHIDEDTLSVVVPVFSPIPPPFEVSPLDSRGNGSATMRVEPMRLAIVRLDGQYIVRELLPALARRYFSISASPDLEYQVAIVRRRAPHTLVYVSYLGQNGELPMSPDATESLLGVRFSLIDSLGTNATAPVVLSGELTGDSVSEFWQLRVTHRAGSLEALAVRTRRENLIAGSTVLALLAGSLVLLVVALRRARALTRQQMEFVAGVSHELRTPVAVVCVTGANLADGLVSDPEQVRRYGRLIQQEGRRLTEMTEQVLSFARIENASRPARAAVAVTGLIHSALQSIQPPLEERGFACDVAVADGLPRVFVDASSVERAIQNLISNALKYSGEGREIRISAGTGTERGVTQVWIAVEDHGIGIYRDELSTIFEPFRRGRGAIERSIPGTGLGLSLVRRIMLAHGGAVRVRSEPGAGSTFTLFLPVADGGPRTAEPASS